jgi:VIT1/CCC1 family predicted Fe2+/Mn2+ transporter
MVLIAGRAMLVPLVAAASLACLAALGAVGAIIGGAPILRPTIRVAFWGTLAMGTTAIIGTLFGIAA